LTGHWFDRTQEFAARLRREDIGRMRYATLEAVTFSPIPCWARLSPELYRVESIETEATLARERTGSSVVGVEAILARDPQHRPASLARSPAPRVHAATKAARRAFYEIYAAFVSVFREASESLRGRDRARHFLPVASRQRYPSSQDRGATTVFDSLIARRRPFRRALLVAWGKVCTVRARNVILRGFQELST